MMIDRRLLSNFDWVLLGVALILAGLGIATLAGIVAGSSMLPASLLERQVLWVGLGIVVLVAAVLTNYTRLLRAAPLLYGVSVIFLLLVLFVGRTGFGATRWIDIGPFSFQPSELAKIAAIVMAARFVAGRDSGGPFSSGELLRFGAIFLIPGFLVGIEPDLGTALHLMMVGGAMTALVGIDLTLLRRGAVALGVLAALLGILHATGVFSPVDLLKDYQRKRIMVLIDPEHDPYGAGYHIRQSKIAIGSGGIIGNGLGKGTQSRLNFLPAQHTDFIFAVFSEAFGFAGSLLVLLLYALLIAGGFSVARRARDRFGGMLAYGLTAMIGVSVVVNIGMTLGFFPVVGIPLPLMSYGGTSTLMTFLALGGILGIGVRRIYYP
jgi:rod shape determining protein RodA